MTRTQLGFTALLATLSLAGSASAQEAEEAEEAEQTEGTEQTAESTSLGTTADDGPRRRRGTAASVGIQTLSDSFGNSLSAPMAGMDVSFGTQINDRFAVYVPIHLSFGAYPGLGTVAGVPAGLTGTLAATVVADVTIADRFFVGGGGGLGILNNPMGPAVHLRAGGYPLMRRMDGSNQRKGLAVALDLRMIQAKGINAMIPSITAAYASF